MFTGDAPRSDAARFFALQVIDSRLAGMGPHETKFVRDNLFPHLQKTVDPSSASSLEPAHMRNKLAQTLAYLFVVTYVSEWPSYLDDVTALMESPVSAVGNASAVDMYLRILRTIHEEIGDNLIIRTPEETKRNNVLKDLVRERGVTKLAASWMSILDYYSSSNADNVTEGLRNDIVEGVLRVIGGWVSWIDISLIVNPPYLTLVFNQLTNNRRRLAACDTLYEIISKKMKPSHKLELIALLNLTTVLAQLPSSWSDIEFDERVAKLSNIVGLELVHIADGTTTLTSGAPCTQEEMDRAEQLLIDLMPTIFGFLSNEYDDTTVQVLQCLSDYLQFIRREAKKEKAKIDVSKLAKNTYGQVVNFPADSTFVNQQRREILTVMLKKIILKMEYDTTTDWSGGEDESESEFLELRSKLKILQDQIGSIDCDLFIDGMAQIITGILESTTKRWQEVELGLYELSCFGESIKNGTFPVVRGVESRASQVFYELFVKMVGSNVIAIDHPSIQLWYMELINKHSSLFTSQRPELLTKALEVFVSRLGVHNPNKKVQVRSWYLFFRFLRAVRRFVGDIADTVFTSISPLLVVRAEVPRLDDHGSEMSADAASGDGTFDQQLFLFELCGMLFSLSAEDNGQRLTQQLLQSVYSDIERCLQLGSQDPQASLQVHHDLMVLGTFARGFDDVTTGDGQIAKNSKRKCMQELKSSTQVILVVLERMCKIEIIRDSVRFAFSRLIPLLGVEILGQVSTLISVLLTECKTHEFGDFLGFLSQLIHSFKTESGVFEMFGSLMTPLVEKVFICLSDDKNDETDSGTDAVILKKELKRSYLQFVFNVLNNGFGAVFLMDSNRGAFQAVMESVFHYSGDMSDTMTQKLAIVTLNKMMTIWGTGEVVNDPTSPAMDVFGKGMKVPGFGGQSIIEQYSQACWTLPGKPGFDVKDAQIRLILGELASLQKAIYDQQGPSYTSYLCDLYLPGLGLPRDLAQEYVSQLSQLKSKEFKKFFVEFITRLS
jgi:exportin-T